MDPIDTFYQHLDSERLLQLHGDTLADDARTILARTPTARVAGLILLPDAAEAATMRHALAQLVGSELPAGPLIAVVPRAVVEPALAKYVGEQHWKEEPWQVQQTLPVVVSTRDGYRFGFFGLGATGAAGEA